MESSLLSPRELLQVNIVNVSVWSPGLNTQALGYTVRQIESVSRLLKLPVSVEVQIPRAYDKSCFLKFLDRKTVDLKRWI